jgi:hypothetical protein
MGSSKIWSPPVVNFRASALFNIYDLPPTINTLSKPILFADDTSVTISNKIFMIYLQHQTVLSHMSICFTSNKLVLNLDKTNIIKFITNKSPQYDLKIGYDEKYTEESINTKFLGLYTDNHLNWKNHIHLMIPTLSRACYAIRFMSRISSTDTLKSIYFLFPFQNEIWNYFLG